MLHRLQGHPEREHEVVGMDAASYEAVDHVDTINAAIYERYKDHTLPEVLVSFRQSHEQVLAGLQGLSMEDLARLTFSDNPAFGTLLGTVIGNTYGHYQEDIEWIGALAEQLGVSQAPS
jgi:hypothetical protein